MARADEMHITMVLCACNYQELEANLLTGRLGG